jgi:hypothetical protein
VCPASPPHRRMFLTGTCVHPLTLRFYLHDDGVLVFSHAADLDVSRKIHNWAHTDEFYVAEDSFGMNDLDLQSPTSPSDLVISLLPRLIFPCFFFLNICIPNSNIWNFVRLASSSSKCSFVINLF